MHRGGWWEWSLGPGFIGENVGGEVEVSMKRFLKHETVDFQIPVLSVTTLPL